MATERLSMRHTREILRQKLTLRRSHRAIAQGLGLSSGTVGATVLRARAAGLDWPQVEALTDDALEGRLYGLRTVAGSRGRPWPDCAALHGERRKPGVTLELLQTRVPRAASRRVSLHPVLRDLPSLARPARPDDAPSPPRR